MCQPKNNNDENTKNYVSYLKNYASDLKSFALDLKEQNEKLSYQIENQKLERERYNKEKLIVYSLAFVSIGSIFGALLYKNDLNQKNILKKFEETMQQTGAVKSEVNRSLIESISQLQIYHDSNIVTYVVGATIILGLMCMFGYNFNSYIKNNFVKIDEYRKAEEIIRESHQEFLNEQMLNKEKRDDSVLSAIKHAEDLKTNSIRLADEKTQIIPFEEKALPSFGNKPLEFKGAVVPSVMETDFTVFIKKIITFFEFYC
jgi:hypothetical protein